MGWLRSLLLFLFLLLLTTPFLLWWPVGTVLSVIFSLAATYGCGVYQGYQQAKRKAGGVPWAEKSSEARALLDAVAACDYEYLNSSESEVPDDVSWNDYRRAAAISVRRLKRWKRQNARRVAKGLPTVPWPYHNKPFPAWDDPALNIETWAPRAGKLERVA